MAIAMNAERINSHGMLNWWRNRQERRAGAARSRLAAIHRERAVLDLQSSLENPSKHDQTAKLREEQNRLERVL